MNKGFDRSTTLKSVPTKSTTIFSVAGLALAAVLLVIASVGVTYSYFTTYATAKGTIELPLSEQTTIDETVSNMTKSVTITNTAPVDDPTSMTVFVRVKAFSGSTYPLIYEGDASWTLGADGYYYYSEPLAPGEVTSKIDVRITGIPEDAPEDMKFNVVVVYETTPALYRADGTPYADWSDILNTGQTVGGDE